MPDFQFIAVCGERKTTDSATRKVVRQHVARQHGKKKRLEDIKNYRSLAPAGTASRNSWLLGRSQFVSPESVESSSSYHHSNSTSLVSSPKSFLDASLHDRFSVFPIRMQAADMELVDFCECLSFGMIYMFEGRSHLTASGSTDLARQRWGPDLGESYRPMRDLFLAQAVEHETSLHGMLFLSASWMSAWRPPKAAESKVLALHHRGKLLEQINGALRHGNFAMPGLLQGIGFQIVSEGVQGNYNSCRRHLIGMRSIILAMGGLGSLDAEPRVQMIFIYLSFDTAPDYLPLLISSQSQTQLAPNGESIPKMIYSTPEELVEINTFINDAVSFLRGIQNLSRNGWAYRLTSDLNPYGPTTLFYHILSPRWLPSTEFTAPMSSSRANQGALGQHRNTRMACLLLLCEALLALNAPSQACDDYMYQQVDVILIERADEKPDLRPFLHLLMKDPRAIRLRDMDVAYRASKNAQVIKRLSVQMSDRVGSLLLACLAGEKGVAESFGEADWGRIREEAFYFRPP